MRVCFSGPKQRPMRLQSTLILSPQPLTMRCVHRVHFELFRLVQHGCGRRSRGVRAEGQDRERSQQGCREGKAGGGGQRQMDAMEWWGAVFRRRSQLETVVSIQAGGCGRAQCGLWTQQPGRASP
jgi:hypothetical protein